MTIQINADGINIPVRHIEFSDGCSNLVIEWPEGFKPTVCVNVSVDPKTPGDKVLFEVKMARDYLKHRLQDCAFWEINRSIRFGLALPYLPHARADRRFEETNATPLHSFLNALPAFDVLYLTDPHSDVARQHLESEGGITVLVKTQAECFKSMGIDVDEVTVLVAPDEGAQNKAIAVTHSLGVTDLRPFKVPIIQASKVRDPHNGRILSTHVDCSDLHGIRCIIVDDIADGGGTFIPLAQKLLEKGADSVELYVTHGIFAKGLEPFRGVIDKIHVYQIVSNYITRADLDAFNSTTYEKPL